MLRDGTVEVEAGWSQEGWLQKASFDERSDARCREIDTQLRAIARKKASFDVEEAKWLREAERHRIWRKLGFSTALEYLEDVFGYAPRTAKDRLRVAKELGQLPELEAELREGALPYSAARELSRVMTPATQGQWLARARGRNLRDIESLVAGHKKGDGPSDPKDPALMTRTLVLELTTRQQALFQQVRAMFERERGEHIDDAGVIEMLCLRTLEGDAPMRGDASPHANDNASVTGKAPRPAHQIVIRKCECNRAWQEGTGEPIEIGPTDLAQAECDAEVVRETDIAAAQASGRRRPPPTPSIPKKIRDLVWARDEGRCRFPGCRATRNLAIHHLRHRAQGGGHDAPNLLLICDGHHKLNHEGIITIRGTAPDRLTFTRDGRRLVDPRAAVEVQRPLVDPGAAAEVRASEELHEESPPRQCTRFDDAVKIEQVTQALKQLGYKARAARAAARDACAHVGTDADIPTVVRKALELSRTEAQITAGTTTDVADIATLRSLAKQALVQSGYTAAIAANAVAAACAHVGTNVDLPTLLEEAFRRCRSS